MSVHRIRLAAPWEWRPIESDTATPPTERRTCQLPFILDHQISELNAAREQGSALLRRFHKPTGITEDTRVVVSVEFQNADVVMFLNNELLIWKATETLPAAPDDRAGSGSHGRQTQVCEADISSTLRSFNELQIQLTRRSQESTAQLTQVSLLIIE